jgi:hypothetical protein
LRPQSAAGNARKASVCSLPGSVEGMVDVLGFFRLLVCSLVCSLVPGMVDVLGFLRKHCLSHNLGAAAAVPERFGGGSAVPDVTRKRTNRPCSLVPCFTAVHWMARAA